MWIRNAIRRLGFGCVIIATHVAYTDERVSPEADENAPVVSGQSRFLLSWSGCIGCKLLFHPPCPIFRNQKGKKGRKMDPLFL